MPGPFLSSPVEGADVFHTFDDEPLNMSNNLLVALITPIPIKSFLMLNFPLKWNSLLSQTSLNVPPG